MATDGAAAATCAVCGGPAVLAMLAECNWCDRRFHLNPRNDIEAKDCGRVWIDEQYLALQFACDDCLAGGDVPPDRADRPRVPEAPRAPKRRYRRRD